MSDWKLESLNVKNLLNLITSNCANIQSKQSIVRLNRFRYTFQFNFVRSTFHLLVVPNVRLGLFLLISSLHATSCKVVFPLKYYMFHSAFTYVC